MRNITLIIFIFFILFLIGTLFVISPLFFFLTIFLAFLISIICLITYLGYRGIFIAIIFIFIPFVIESLFFRFDLLFFEQPLIRSLTISQINLALTLNNLFFLFTIPLLFMTALFFAQKIRLYFNLKSYHKTFIAVISSLLVSINFLVINQNTFAYTNFIKWLIIALIINSLVAWLFYFKPLTAELYKELPIIIYLAIYGTSALKKLEPFQLIVIAVLTISYLVILYHEYKYKKIRQQA